MFGAYSNLATAPRQTKVDPANIPSPTPIALPRYQPFAQDGVPIDPLEALPNLLKTTGRSSAALGPIGLNALGLDLKLDVSILELSPDHHLIPEFSKWDDLSPDQLQSQNEESQRPLRTGKLFPGCQIYRERREELSHANQDAFRTVRRLSPLKGKQTARLGNAYEFFRCLELFTEYWDDPTQKSDVIPSPETSALDDLPNDIQTEDDVDNPKDNRIDTVRIASGKSMPAEFRNNLVAAFIKLVAYDFGCSVGHSRVEPRLYLSSPRNLGPDRKSYCPSHFQFVFQSPQSREAARAGLVHGPVAAVSTRPTVDFNIPNVETAQSLDLAREILSSLITAQHRIRQGKTEKRLGDGQWWTTKPRWGGGTGGPIGREVEENANGGVNDIKPVETDGSVPPAAKRPRKNLPMYDAYRLVRPPSHTWDRKTSYELIGKEYGTNYDDVFVISSIFHHISFLRVRVPIRLLEVLDGSPEPDFTHRSWGKLQAWRSCWFDLFDINQRIAAMQTLWSIMAYQMRQDTSHGDSFGSGSAQDPLPPA